MKSFWIFNREKLGIPTNKNKRVLFKRSLTKKWIYSKDRLLHLVGSNLEYSSILWYPFTKRSKNKLERVQCRATTLILKSNEPYNVFQRAKHWRKTLKNAHIFLGWERSKKLQNIKRDVITTIKITEKLNINIPLGTKLKCSSVSQDCNPLWTRQNVFFKNRK